MQLEYIEKNLDEIMQNPDSIMYLRPYDIGKKRALFAMVKEDPGVYRKVQITKEESKMTFPFEPIYWFHNGPGYFLLRDFVCFDNTLALNIANLDGFKATTLEGNNIFSVGVFATFNDGSATFVKRERPKKFKKQNGIQSYIDLLKQYKECDPKYDTYEIIECYGADDDTFVIPKLQKKTEEQQKVKELIPNTKKDD